MNITPVGVIKKGTFGSTYFREIYSGINGKFYKNSWKECKDLENIDKKYYCSDYYDATLNKYGVKCGTSLRFWENNNGLIKLTLMDSFNGILDTG